MIGGVQSTQQQTTAQAATLWGGKPVEGEGVENLWETEAEEIGVEEEEEMFGGEEKLPEEVVEAQEAVAELGGNASLKDIDALNQELERLIAESDNAAREMDLKKKELADEEQKLEEEKLNLAELENQYKAKGKEYESIQDAIDSATEDLEESVKEAQRRAIYQAMSDYNEEKDGDWKDFLKERLGDVVGSDRIANMLTTLGNEQASIAREMGTIQLHIDAQKLVVSTIEGTVNGLKQDVTNLQGIIDQNEVQISSIQDRIVQAIISTIDPKEMALAKNIDLTEKYPDGSPKYIFAKGKEDGQYHIYEMDADGKNGTTLARKLPDRGFNIVRSGNGYLHGMQQTENDCASPCDKIYYLNECKTAGSFTGNYTTCSPLAFDLDGNGINTSNEIIEYDIDGDGILDKIYNSADAILVFDKDGDGIVGEDGSECFGNNTDLDGDGQRDGFTDGFAALKALAAQEGLIGEGDSVLDAEDLSYLGTKFGLSMKVGGYNSEAVSLADLGITEINLGETTDTNLIDNFDGNGNQLMTQDGATFVQDGETKEYADIWHRKIEE